MVLNFLFNYIDIPASLTSCVSHLSFFLCRVFVVFEERHDVRESVLHSWNEYFKSGNCVPAAYLDPDHLHKQNLSFLQYGGSGVPYIHGTQVAANFMLMANLKNMPLCLFRRTDFAASSMPHAIASPHFVEELIEKSKACVGFPSVVFGV
jgi:hypothetical protein